MADARQVLLRDASIAIAYLPHLASALIILIVGSAIAWLLGRIVRASLGRLGLDALADRTGLTEDFASVGMRVRPSQLIGALTFWTVFVAAMVQAIDTLELAPLSDALRSLLAYLPHVVLAVVVVIAGIITGNMIARGTADRMSRAGILYHAVAGTVLRTTVIVVTILMALQQLTVDSAFLFYVLLVLLGGAALAGGIAAGWGARTLAENLVAGRYVERQFAVGQAISVDGTSGTIERLEPASLTIVTDDGRRVILPKALLTRTAVEAGTTPESPPQSSMA